MKKNRDKVIIIALVVCCIIGSYKVYPYVFKEKGSLYSLRMIKGYTDCNYGKIQASKNGSKDEKEENTQNYNNGNEESKKILDYLNKFKLKEIGNEEASKNEKIEVLCITFDQCYDEDKNQLKSSKKLTITLYTNDILKITTSNKCKVSKYYKITEGNIDFKYINKILSNAEKSDK